MELIYTKKKQRLATLRGVCVCLYSEPHTAQSFVMGKNTHIVLKLMKRKVKYKNIHYIPTLHSTTGLERKRERRKNKNCVPHETVKWVGIFMQTIQFKSMT